MSKEQVQQHTAVPSYIPGISEYCDRWCERCPFTAHCRQFAKLNDREASLDVQDPAFWYQMSEFFPIAYDFLEDMAAEMGAQVGTDDAFWRTEEDRFWDDQAKEHELSQKAERYTTEVNAWFEYAQRLIYQRDSGIGQTEEVACEGQKVMQDAVEIIHWYQYQIHVKLLRAIREDLKAGSVFESKQREADGLAKTALVGMDRSIGAWTTLWQEFPKEEDTILVLLIHLEQLRSAVEQDFPQARAFKRPGFDQAASALGIQAKLPMLLQVG